MTPLPIALIVDDKRLAHVSPNPCRRNVYSCPGGGRQGAVNRGGEVPPTPTAEAAGILRCWRGAIGL